MNAVDICLLVTAIAVALVPYIRRKLFISRHYPPGPKGLPILGNLFQLSQTPWVPFTQWKEEYGEIVYLNVLGQPIIVLNSVKTATDLLDRRSRIYSDRPKSVVGNDMLSGGMNIALLSYTPMLRKLRRISHEGLSKRASNNYQPFRIREVVQLLRSLVKEPKAWRSHVEKSGVYLTLSILYGLPKSDEEREWAIENLNTFIARMTYTLAPGNYLAEFIPFMKYLPSSIAKWKGEVLQWSKESTEFYQKLYKSGRDNFKDGGLVGNLSKAIYQEQSRYSVSDDYASWLMAILYVAGAETSQTQVAWLILAMAKYQDVQERAQEELDAVVGRSRMPTLEDIERLPYIQATVKEVLRWVPPAPVGLPHAASKDDWYNGYFIPKGTLCIFNLWGIHRDKELFGLDADEFNPSRFLDEHGQISLSPKLWDSTKGEGHVGFGFGKRICPGRYIAEDNLHLTVANLLWALKIRPKSASVPNPINNYLFNGVILQPKVIDCDFIPRFPELDAILEHAADHCQ
ncbi:cytochrome P450 [Abortiporus biennis]|nr:cytochrome P450 [Abortiporus biennis]